MITLPTYDAIPYDSIPITDTHVDTLAATARLFGVDAPDPRLARVLELGCAEGGNLLPMAFYLPGAHFVGIDLSQRQIEIGQQCIDQAGLKNITLLHRDVMQGADDLGEFDYIIAHGLYSWVPPAVQEKILDICARQLTKNGIAYVSFNTLPGWRLRGMVRDLLLHHTCAATTARARLALAYQYIETHAAPFENMESPEARFIADELRYLRQAPASYLYHEYLEEVNEPLLFADFMQRAQAAGLQYVADTELYTMLPATLGETARLALAEIDDRIAREQQMDFLRGRRFRRTLLTHAGTSVRGAPDPAAFEQLGFYADLSTGEEIDLGADNAQTFISATGGRVQIRHPLAKAAAMLLASRYPDSLSFDELLDGASALVAAHGDPRMGLGLDEFRTELFSLVAWQAVRLSCQAHGFGCDVAAHPHAHTLARAQLAADNECVASLRHTAVHLDDAAARLLRQLDGTRTLDDLAADMALSVEGDAAGIRDACERMLWTFARNGLTPI